MGSWPAGKPSRRAAVDEEDVQPAVVVVVVESDAAAGGLEQIFVLVLAAEDGFGIQAGVVANVDEAEPQAGIGLGGRGLLQQRRGRGRETRNRKLENVSQGPCQFENAFQRQCRRRLPGSLEKPTARRGQKGDTFPELARARIRPYFIKCIATLQVAACILIQSHAWNVQLFLRCVSFRPGSSSASLF